jgi:hypothetical protein
MKEPRANIFVGRTARRRPGKRIMRKARKFLMATGVGFLILLTLAAVAEGLIWLHQHHPLGLGILMGIVLSAAIGYAVIYPAPRR